MSPVVLGLGLTLLVFGAVATTSEDTSMSRLGFVFVSLAVVISCIGVLVS